MTVHSPMRLVSRALKAFFLALVLLGCAGTAQAAQLLRDLGGTSGYGSLAMGRNDDGSSSLISLGAGFPNGVNFFGRKFTALYINNNGNLTFNGSLGWYTPVPFPVSSQPMIAPYWADVDTRAGTADPLRNNVYYARVDNRFIVTWNYVGYYSYRIDRLNAFQVILTDRSDVAPGDFDVEFRYEQLQWTKGAVSAVAAQMGFDAGDRKNYYSHPYSRTEQILQLTSTSNVDDPGVWLFEIRSGIVNPDPIKKLKDVRIIDTISVNGNELDLASFSKQPYSVTPAGDKTLVEWRYDTFAANLVEDFGFNVLLKNPTAGERRVVSHKLELQYIDPNGKLARTELPEQFVDVLPSAYQLGVATDKAVYVRDERVAITSTVKNLSGFPRQATLHLMVKDANGVLVSDLGSVSTSLGPNETKNVTGLDFNTGKTYAGSYQVQADVIDAAGSLYARSVAPFAIVAGVDGNAQATLLTDGTSYAPLSTVTITERITNTSTNSLLEDLTATTVLYKPDGNVFWSGSTAVAQLLPGLMQELNYSVPLGAAAPGTYRLVMIVKDAQGNTIQTIEKIFTVESTAETGVGLGGSIAAEPGSVRQTERLMLTATVENRGNAAAIDVPVSLIVLDPANERVVAQWPDVPVSLAPNGVHVFSESFDVTARAGTVYLVALRAQVGGQYKLLASRSVVVAKKVDAQLAVGAKGRLLVLVDKAAPEDDAAKPLAGDPHGPKGAPDQATQLAHLQGLLEAAGWSYSIVDDVDAFRRELFSGGYSSYALFAEHQKLDDDTQNVLREAVFRGEGLFVAGIHDSRNVKLEQIMGLKQVGQANATAALFGESFDDVTIALAADDKALRIARDTAESVAVYVGGMCSSTNTCDSATFNRYGAGAAVFVGFDLLALASAQGGNVDADNVLRDLLEKTVPDAVDFTIGGGLPMEVALQNLGAGLAVQINIELPEGVGVLDAGAATYIGNRLAWDVVLGDDELLTLPFWLHLPAQPGFFTLQGTVDTSLSGATITLADLLLTLQAEEQDSDALIAMLDALAAGGYEAATLRQVKNAIERAKGYLTDQPSKALSDALLASDALARIATAEIAPIRTALARWVKQIAQRVLAYPPPPEAVRGAESR